jgi:tetratricopeptide (TPR) repeat protein
MPIIKRNLNPLCYLAGLDLADQAAHRSAFKIYLNSFRYVVLALLLVGIPISLTGDASGVMNTPTGSHQRMLILLKQIADQTAETNNYIGEGIALQLRRHLANLPIDASDLTRWRLHVELGEAELRLGNEAAAIDQLIQAGRLLPRLKGQLSSLMANQTLFRLGVAYMRQGETQNCCPNQAGIGSNPDSCILPLRDGGIHTQQKSSQNAITYLTEVLRNTTVELPLHLEARWLLNIAYMTIGGYPEQVPKPYLLPPEAFQSTEEMPRFINIAPHLGLDTFDLSGGAIIDDFDNDNYLDIVVSTWDPAGQIRFFRNNRDGTFSDQTEQAGLLGLYGGLNLLQADYDNDDDVDILVLRGAWLEAAGQHPNSLLRNNGDGTFTDETFGAGLGDIHYPTQTASWGDYDNDGDLDLYIGNESTEAFNAPCQLFRNNGDGTFSDVAAEAGIQNYGFTKSVVWGDYDADRFPDLYVSNFKGFNRLYRNNGDGTFTDAATELNIDLPKRSFPAWFWDFDNDGVLDLYVSAYSAGISHLAAKALGLPMGHQSSTIDAASESTYHNRPDLSEDGLAHLYRGDGNGRFKEVGRQYNLIQPNAPMGSNFGDLDNDGYLDFYLGTGYPDYKNLMPSIMYRNRRGTDFVDVTYAGGFGHLQKGHGVVFADLDNDGDQDIFEQMGGAFPGDGYSNVLYENPGLGHHFVTIKLVGVDSNRSAIGARIHLKVLEHGEQRSVYKHINSGGSFGANPLRQTLGLGTADKIETLEIFWPTTAITQRFHDVPLNQFIQITEGETQYTIIQLKKLKLGTGTQTGSDGSEITKDSHKLDSTVVSQTNSESSDLSEKESVDYATFYNDGLDLSRSENYLRAVESLKKAIQIDPDREEAHRLLGRIYLLYLAKTTEAIESFQTSIRLAPSNSTPHQMLGVAYFKQNKYPEAIQALRRAITLNPEVTPDYPYHPYYDLGMVYLKQSSFDNAISCLEQAIELDPNQIRAYYSLGNAYIRQGNVQKGAELIRKYQRLKPYMNLVSQLEIALQQNPENPERWHQLGSVHAQYGRFEKAIEPLEQSIKLSPGNWEVYNVLAVCYMRLNRLEKMQRVCQSAVRLAPDESKAHNTLGMSYFLQRRYVDASQSFITATRLEPRNPEFHENLGETYKRLGEPKKAAQEFRIARQLRGR